MTLDLEAIRKAWLKGRRDRGQVGLYYSGRYCWAYMAGVRGRPWPLTEEI